MLLGAGVMLGLVLKTHACWMEDAPYFVKPYETMTRWCVKDDLASHEVSVKVRTGNAHVALASGDHCRDRPQWSALDWTEKLVTTVESPNINCTADVCCFMVDCVSAEACAGEYSYRARAWTQHMAIYEPETCARDDTQVYVAPGKTRVWACDSTNPAPRSMVVDVNLLSPETEGVVRTNELEHVLHTRASAAMLAQVRVDSCAVGVNCSIAFECAEDATRPCVFSVHGAMVPGLRMKSVLSTEDRCGSGCQVGLWFFWIGAGIIVAWLLRFCFNVAYHSK